MTGSALSLALAFAAVACGGGGSESDGPNVSLTGPALGEQTARAKGCAGCHGQDFDGAAGPSWIGLAGSDVTLADGSTVLADDDYLTRAIKNPAAEIADGYNLKMPANNLLDSEIAEIVVYINSLADG
ncbi:MAG: c-type cytochrome [Ilumatobacteraceae bacterium]